MTVDYLLGNLRFGAITISITVLLQETPHTVLVSPSSLECCKRGARSSPDMLEITTKIVDEG